MDYLYFVLIILALAASVYLLRRSEKRTKNKCKKAAYRLLDSPNPGRGEITNSIKYLRLYGGRWHKDKEFLELIKRLQDRLNKIDASDT